MRLVIDLQGAQCANHQRGIGRYARELARAMAANPRGHEVIVALNSAFADTAESAIGFLSDVLPRENIRLWSSSIGRDVAASGPQLTIAQTVRAQFLASLRPDMVHVSSLFEGQTDAAVTLQPAHLERLPVVATCYDLIPRIYHKTYFGDGPQPSDAAKWYYRRLQELFLSDGLLAISASSRDEAIRYLSYNSNNIFNIQAGVGPEFSVTPLAGGASSAFLARYGLREDFILFLGGGDLRKNEGGLIAAYALLPQSLRARHQLVIVSKADDRPLRDLAQRLGIPRDEIVMIPHVAEEDLKKLYSACGVFVFPSLHEGFGFPVAEAMACGAPTLASHATSLPEIVGRQDAMFNPADPAAIAERMSAVLTDPAFRAELAQWGPVQAARFTWSGSAERAWDALEIIHERKTAQGKGRSVVPSVMPARPRLAFVSPFPPQPTGIADYSYDLVFVLARFYDITLVTEADIADIRLQVSFPLLRPKAFLEQAGSFDRVVYHVGNSHMHEFQIQELLPNCPGVVVLHDAFLSHYMLDLARRNNQAAYFCHALFRSHGYPALKYLAENGYDKAVLRYPCSLPVLESALGVIQHSHFSVAMQAHFYGAKAASHIQVIPLLRAERSRLDKRSARERLVLGPDEFVVCSFGLVIPEKCPELLVQAWLKAGIKGRFVFVGGIDQHTQHSLSVAESVQFAGRVTQDVYDLWLAAADVAVQWRRHSRGETSAAIADTLVAGLPLVYNRHGSASELPEGIACALPDDASVEELAQALVALHNAPEQRQALGQAARDYAVNTLAPDVVARRYRETIENLYSQSYAPIVAGCCVPELQALGSVTDAVSALQSIARTFRAGWAADVNPRIFVDLSSNVLQEPAVREIGRRVLEAPPEGYRATATRTAHGQIRESYGNACHLLGLAPLDLPEQPIDGGTNDILLFLARNAALTAEDFSALKSRKLDGVKIVQFLHTPLPTGEGDDIAADIAAWYTNMLPMADVLVCTSPAVADSVVAWLSQDGTVRRGGAVVVAPTPSAPEQGHAQASPTEGWDACYRGLCHILPCDKMPEEH